MGNDQCLPIIGMHDLEKYFLFKKLENWNEKVS